jgi:hypothetical protein
MRTIALRSDMRGRQYDRRASERRRSSRRRPADEAEIAAEQEKDELDAGSDGVDLRAQDGIRSQQRHRHIREI